MADFRLPELGEGITEADIVRVLVHDGDTVGPGQAIATIETEKASVDVPSDVSGRITQVQVHEGQTVSPGTVLFTFEEAGAAASTQQPAAAPPAAQAAQPVQEPAPQPQQAAPAPSAEQTAPQPQQASPAPPSAAPGAPPPASEAPAPAPQPVPAEQTPAPAPPTQPAASTPAHPEAAPAPSTPPPPAEPIPTSAVAPQAQTAFAAPSVRSFAREIGVDINAVHGSGPGGRIDLEDVKQHARERASAPAQSGRVAPPLPDFSQFGPIERQPITRFRRTVARNMATSWSRMPHVTLFRSADTGAFENIRRRYRDAASKAGGVLTDGVLLMKIVATGLQEFPQFNSSLDEATEELILKRYIHIGLAVDTERGLAVSVVRDVDKKTIVDLAADFKGVSERVKANKLELEEMRGASFTISTLESLGISHFTPIVNWPEVAILGVGRDADLPSYEREELHVHKRVALSLSFDHRVVDGADGARFLRWLVNAIHEPTMLEIPGAGS